MRRGVSLLIGGVLVLAAALIVRAARYTGTQINPEPAEPLALDSARIVERLAAALRIPTISGEDSSKRDPAQLIALQHLLDAEFPRVRAALSRETVGRYSLLYTWSGTDAALPAVILTSHQDVVPADAAAWSHPPFSGTVADGFIWGRGALDDKVGVLGILEAVEALAATGFRPRRTVYLAFGHDEEVGGEGARAIAALLESRHARIDVVVDEGGAVVRGIIPGVSAPVATVGIAEKGSVSLALEAHAAAGHSSTPPSRTAIGALSRAIERLERDQFPARLDGAALGLFGAVAPEMAFRYRLLFANLWLFRPVVLRALTASPTTAAAVRTTIAPTIVEGGAKANVLPGSARAVVNLRILPGDSVAAVVRRVREVIDDSLVGITILGAAEEPSPVAPVDAAPFQAIARAIRQIYPTAIVAPYLVLGATDARHYAGLTRNVYRFAPLLLTQTDLDRIHGVDERIAVADYLSAVRWYGQLIRQVAR